MAEHAIIDGHVHFWPNETCNEEGHAWMTPGDPLCKAHLMTDYLSASTDAAKTAHEKAKRRFKGVVYVETDVRYSEPSGDVSEWARGPLDEISFLRGVVEGRYGASDGQLLLGIVPWAPMDQPTPVLELYLALAEQRAGSLTWSRIKGFRYLLQFIGDESKFEKLVTSDDFVNNLKLLGRRGFSFDVGVDQNSGGLFQLDHFASAMVAAHRSVPDHDKVVFVINHLCKPDYRHASGTTFDQWCQAITAMSKQDRTFMKLSGAFSELPDGLCSNVAEVAQHIRPWVHHALQVFTAERILFGSDWPVCNVKGIAGERSRTAWEDVVAVLLNDESLELTMAEKEQIWHGTARKAYRLEQRS